MQVEALPMRASAKTRGTHRLVDLCHHRVDKYTDGTILLSPSPPSQSSGLLEVIGDSAVLRALPGGPLQ